VLSCGSYGAIRDFTVSQFLFTILTSMTHSKSHTTWPALTKVTTRYSLLACYQSSLLWGSGGGTSFQKWFSQLLLKEREKTFKIKSIELIDHNLYIKLIYMHMKLLKFKNMKFIIKFLPSIIIKK
jgi:hypothetical protein